MMCSSCVISSTFYVDGMGYLFVNAYSLKQEFTVPDWNFIDVWISPLETVHIPRLRGERLLGRDWESRPGLLGRRWWGRPRPPSQPSRRETRRPGWTWSPWNNSPDPRDRWQDLQLFCIPGNSFTVFTIEGCYRPYRYRVFCNRNPSKSSSVVRM